jgi:hypothetical protein
VHAEVGDDLVRGDPAFLELSRPLDQSGEEPAT